MLGFSSIPVRWMRQAKKQAKRRSGRVRIVAGEWRGRRIDVADVAALRPTPDRQRETLFNWLVPSIAGARVLDLYAGTGVLGFEALSRGAAHTVFVERDRKLCAALTTTAATLGATARSDIRCAPVERVLRGSAEPVDLVFADPPYAASSHGELCKLLVERGWLNDGALVYLEQSSGDAPPAPGPCFEPLKNNRAGEAAGWLFRYDGGSVDDAGE